MATLPVMRFRWDWLCPQVGVPYVPTLGPVQPRALSVHLFNDIVSVAGIGAFLPYDKDRRWSATKDEHVLTGEIIHSPSRTVIPTLSARSHGVVKIHHYGRTAPDLGQLAGWARELCARYGAAAGKAIWFQDTPAGARTRLLLKTYHDRDEREHGRQVTELRHCEAAGTFPAFASQLGEGGFLFLLERIAAGLDDGPILVAVEDERIVGAIGPLSTLTDASGYCIVPPQYFAIHPAYRRRGHGRSLWRASMAWGREHGAVCKILQTEVSSPAERLYLAEGLETLGFTMHPEPIPTSSSKRRFRMSDIGTGPVEPS